MMYVRFTLPDGATITFQNILNVDFSMYGKIRFSAMSTPVFKVTFFCDYPKRGAYDDSADDFAYWWGEVKPYDYEDDIDYLQRMSVSIFSEISSISIAIGRIYEYEKKCDSLELVISCQSYIKNISVALSV
jgi:hypothetical protein